MQYICKEIVQQNRDFPAKLQELIKLINDNNTFTNIKATQTKTTELEEMYEEAIVAKTEVEACDQPDDKFKSVVGEYIEMTARIELDMIKKDKDDIMKTHKEICDFYTVDKNDEVRNDSIEFFKMWKVFLQDVSTSLPKGLNRSRRTLAKKVSKRGSSVDKDAKSAMQASIDAMKAKFA